MKLQSSVRKPLGVRVTPDQHRLLTEAAGREHRSVSSFVLRAALQAAEGVLPKPKRSRDEVEVLVRAACEEIQAVNPTNRDLLAELLAERRREAAHE